VPYVRDILAAQDQARAGHMVGLDLGLGVTGGTIAQFQAGATDGLLAMTSCRVFWACVAPLHSLSVCDMGTARLRLRRHGGAVCCGGWAWLLSQVLHSPLVALLIIIGVDAVGYSLTIAKTWDAPETETLELPGCLGVLRRLLWLPGGWFAQFCAGGVPGYILSWAIPFLVAIILLPPSKPLQ
jgi:hypothetical protein